MNTTSRIHVGRQVRYFAGYGSIDGTGCIVRVHGTPSASNEPASHGFIGIIRPDHCTVDVILEDGRELLGLHQCSIDRPGIGIKLLDDVTGPAGLAALALGAVEYKARKAIEKAKARAEFEAREAARVITDPPVFFWNGIKDAKGAKLQRCAYSDGKLIGYPDGTITIYARDYHHFSEKVHACFDVKNDTDTQTDYFDDDRIRVIPAHPLYEAVRAAMESRITRAAARAARS